MEVLQQRIQKRRDNFRFYKMSLADVAGISFFEEPSADFYSNHWLTIILLDPSLTGGITREDLRLYFESVNVESRPLWKPMHLQPVFEDCPAYVNGTSEHLFDIGLCLPSSSNITDDERQRVVDALRKLILK